MSRSRTSFCARLSALVLAAITTWLWAATPGADSVAREDAKAGSRAVNGGGSGPLLVQLPHVARLSHRRPDVTAWLAVMRSLSTQPRGRPTPGLADPGSGQGQKGSPAATGSRIHGTARPLHVPGTPPPLRAGSIRLSQRASTRHPDDTGRSALVVPSSPANHVRDKGDPAPVSAHLRFRHDPGGH